MNFSVLMSIYINDNIKYFDDALKSLVDQTVIPNEVVIVQDGPVKEEAKNVILSYKNKLNIKTVPLEKNVGLGKALATGLAECSFELVARMDADDICVKDRFEKQLKYFVSNSDIAVLGGSILEFEESPELTYGRRSLPKAHSEIARYFKMRNPINHVTVMFKKSAVLKVGNYETFLGFEDYFLWGKMLKAGFLFQNMEDDLVLVRTGNAMFGRRRGIKYLLEEYNLYYNFYKLDFLTLYEFIKAFVVRGSVRMFPSSIIRLVYKKVLRSN